jgi:hypothetical protein
MVGGYMKSHSTDAGAERWDEKAGLYSGMYLTRRCFSGASKGLVKWIFPLVPQRQNGLGALGHRPHVPAELGNRGGVD